MVEVVTVQQFDELKKLLEEFSRTMDELADKLVKQGEKVDRAVADVNRRIDIIEEKSKGVFAKVKEALKFE